MGWNYQLIQTTARKVTGQISNVSLTNADLGQYINNYYQFDLPRELKLEELYVQRQFALTPNKPAYDLPGDFTDNLAFTHVEPRIYVNGISIGYTQDSNEFYSIVPATYSTETIAYGDAVTTVFPYSTNFTPIYNIRAQRSFMTQPCNITISDGVETFVDVPTVGSALTGTFTGDAGGTGTVNYYTGATSVTFAAAPASGAVIQITYHYQQTGQPNTVLFYSRQFIFSPTPDQAYLCRIDAYQQPMKLSNPTDTPVKEEWGELIALGAALKILRDFGQTDKYQETMMFYNREKTKCLSDTDNQLMSYRAKPRF